MGSLSRWSTLIKGTHEFILSARGAYQCPSGDFSDSCSMLTQATQKCL